MALYQLTSDHLLRLNPTRFDQEGIRERADLQRLLREHIDVLGEDLLVISEEFSGFEESRRRIDVAILHRQR